MKKNIIWALCGFCGGLMPSLLFGKYVLMRLLRMKKMYCYMPALYKNLRPPCNEGEEKKASLEFEEKDRKA